MMNGDLLKKAVGKEETLPDWVSTKNKSYEAYWCVQRIRKERAQYIREHRLSDDFRRKRDYQINGSEVAKEIGIAPATLTATSGYSEAFKEYLAKVNLELEELKNDKVSKGSKKKGLKQEKKDDLVTELRRTKDQLSVEKEKNATEIAQTIIEELPLPIKRKLGIN